MKKSKILKKEFVASMGKDKQKGRIFSFSFLAVILAIFPFFLMFPAVSMAIDPEVSSVLPTAGLPETGITIQGTNFQPGALAGLYGGGPHIVGSCDAPGMPGDARSVALVGNHAYVADGHGLKVVDISDLSSPLNVGSCETSFSSDSVAVSGSYAYVIGWDGTAQKGRLAVIDISNPAAPIVVGSCDTPGYAQGEVAVSNGYAYVAEGFNALLDVFDVSDPSAPNLVASLPLPSSAASVALAGNYAYVAGAHGLRIVDISDPTNPYMISNCYLLPYTADVAISGSYAYIVGDDTSTTTSLLQAVDISDPYNLMPVGTCRMPRSAYGVAAAGSFAYVANYYDGMQVIDISDPFHPHPAGTCHTPGEAKKIALMGDYAYVADGGSGLQVIDVSQPVAPSSVGGYITGPGTAESVAVADGHAFVPFEGLHVFDISDPANPTLVGVQESSHFSHGIAVQGNYAYLTSGFGLEIADISDLSNPQLVGNYDTPHTSRGIVLMGNYAYLADDKTGLLIIDVSDPVAPQLVGSCDTPGEALDVAILGDFAYVADWNTGLRTINISDPANPSLVGHGYTAGYARGVAVAGAYAYVVADKDFRVFDISNPASPLSVGNCTMPDWTRHVAVAGDYAYVASERSGVQVMDISDPTKPRLVGGSSTPSFAHRVVPSGGHVYVADYYGGLQVVRAFLPLADVSYVNATTLTATTPCAQKPGTWNLHVTNPDGGRGILHNAFTAFAGSGDCPPEANFSAGVTSGMNPLQVIFTDLSSPAWEIHSWTWDFDGDGTFDSYDQNPAPWTYTEAGDYTVSLTVTSPGGTDTETKVDYIHVDEPLPPEAAFMADVTTGTKPLGVQFYDQSTGPITSWSWNFGDGGSSAQQNPPHQYTDAGDYTVSLTVTGPGGSDSETKTDYIHVTEPTTDPVIDRIRGVKEPGRVIRIIGSGFGDAQGDSEVHIGPKVYGPGHTKIKLWTDTMIKVKLLNYKCAWFKGNDFRRRKIWVVVKDSPEDEGIPSNVKRIKVFKPGSCL